MQVLSSLWEKALADETFYHQSYKANGRPNDAPRLVQIFVFKSV